MFKKKYYQVIFQVLKNKEINQNQNKKIKNILLLSQTKIHQLRIKLIKKKIKNKLKNKNNIQKTVMKKKVKKNL